MERADNRGVTRCRIAVLAAALALALAWPGAADAKTRKNLWATVNVCDTEAHPNELGIRARMPGDGSRERMYMRFYAQYVSPDDNKWHNVTSGGHSPWQYAGSALFRYQELGWNFRFDELDPGSGYTMRGMVRFEWRDRKTRKVVRRTHVLTSAGRKARGADPPGYSEATCFVMA
jgi:hypothetical protein